MPSLSVVIVTFNEEANIRAALDSARWADEIVVVDSFSTDSTVDICREYTDRVYREQWRGFSSQKSYAVSLARNDWVFVLDADERITQELAAEIRDIISEVPARTGYYVPRRNHFMGREIKYCGWSPDYSIRLFDRRRGAFKERAVHEAVELSGEAGYLKAPMLHYTYNSISDYIIRMDRYSALAAEEMIKTGRRARLPDLLLKPVFTFFKMFVIRQGFNDGIYGLVISILYSFYTFSKYAKLWEMREKQ